jgi:uncharacterized protein (TIGR02466 family)
MINEQLIPLFAKPMFKTTIDLNLDMSNIEWLENYNNSISSSQQVLDTKEFAQIKQAIMEKVQSYFYGIINASPECEIYITESWVNKTEKGQSHHRHWHPNSILSGIVSLATDNQGGATVFITSSFDTLEYDIIESNLYNSKRWGINLAPGEMLIFPSSVEHLVEEYQGDSPRITLSFNTFLRGTINKHPLTKLVI